MSVEAIWNGQDEELLSLLHELTTCCGPCGFEQPVVRVLLPLLQKIADEVHVDGLGNVIARKKGHHAGPRLVVAAHMDEVGFIVKKIEENGLLRFEKLGGHDDRIVLAQRVRVRTEKQGELPGVIGTISAHMTKFDDAQKVRKHTELYVDIGAQDRSDVEAMGVQIGDPICWGTTTEKHGPYRLSGKSFDDRAGCAVLLQAFAEVNAEELHGEFVAAFTVQEEVGLRGARVVARTVSADVALAVDTTAVSDTPEAMMDGSLRLGAGPGIKVMDFSLIASSVVRRQLVNAAETTGLPYQFEVFPGIGTDGGELSEAGQGVPTGVISIPSRYAHSPIELIDRRDLWHCKELLKAFVRSMRAKEQFSFLA